MNDAKKTLTNYENIISSYLDSYSKIPEKQENKENTYKSFYANFIGTSLIVVTLFMYVLLLNEIEPSKIQKKKKVISYKNNYSNRKKYKK